MGDKASVLEKRVHELEMENRWLKGLITEKDGENESIRDRYSRFLANGGEKTLREEIEAESTTTS